jgi:hypothetical protein
MTSGAIPMGGGEGNAVSGATTEAGSGGTRFSLTAVMNAAKARCSSADTITSGSFRLGRQAEDRRAVVFGA